LAEQNVSIKAYDVTGRLILDEVKAADMGTNNYELNANFVQGIYLFELKTNTNTIIKKVIIAN
jgi:hypothetical protein